jgi:uroporphyrin-III C-methyltransferase
MSGKVYLVGAGPGDPELLTRKAYRLICEADVVLHDELVPAEILALVPETAALVNVGKRCGGKHVSQELTNALLVAYASDGAMVVRLKGGDPMIFGRAGEEMDALREAGIAFEVVPGITAALGAAAAAQVPLTDRRSAPGVSFLTGHHCAQRVPPAESARSNGRADEQATLVLYMPGSDYASVAAGLVSRGWAQDTPCLVVSHATLPDQQIMHTTLAGLPGATRFAAPAILIVGAVAREVRSEDDSRVAPGELAVTRTFD